MNSNKIAVVTGGAFGYKSGGPSIGGAISQKLAQDGFTVVVVDLESDHGTTNHINESGGEARFVQADVTNTEDIHSLIQTIKNTYGRLDCLVNGVAKYSPGMAKTIAEITEEDWYDILNVNIHGYFKMCKYSIPFMLETEGGSIINISSIESNTALPNFGVYSVSKAAVDALTRSIATDFAPNIRCNSILPGFVKIANSENNRTPKELEDWYADIAKKYPMKRVCEPHEIANVVSFLASEQSSYINGQSIVVDGGKSVADYHTF